MSADEERRFPVGARVVCRVAADQWAAGTVTSHDWQHASGQLMPYQVQLEEHDTAVFCPVDHPDLIRAWDPELMRSVADRYVELRKHPDLFEPKVQDGWLDPRFAQIVSAFRQHQSLSASERRELEASLGPLGFVKHSDEVYSFPVFSDQFIKQFNEEINSFYASGLPATRPNSMNNYGIIVNEIGWPRCRAGS